MADKTWVVNGTVRKMPNIAVTATAELHVIMNGPGGALQEDDYPFTTDANGVYGFEFTVADTWTISVAQVQNFSTPYTYYSGGGKGTISGNNLPINTCFVLNIQP